jgi:hypothetical protein
MIRKRSTVMRTIRSKFFLLAGGVLLGSVLAAGPARAFTTIGNWADGNIPPLMSVNQSGTNDCGGEFKALFFSGRTWNNVSGSYFYFDRRTPTLNNRHAGSNDGYNQISWDPASPSEYIAVTYNYGWLFINETDISFNSNYDWNCLGNPSWTEMDVQNIATHELGHSLGLGHSSYSTATMYAYANYGETQKRSLHWDDIDGIEYLYPASALEELDRDELPVDGGGFFLMQPRRQSGLIEVRFGLPDEDREYLRTELAVYNVDGERVRTLVRGTVPAGEHRFLWDGRNDAGETVSPGVYFLTLEAGGRYASKKLLPSLF